MRLLLLLASAFLTAFAGGGFVARAADGSPVVASAAEVAPSREAQLQRSSRPEQPFAPPLHTGIEPAGIWAAVPAYPAYADRLRL